MNFKELVFLNRSYRKFQAEESISDHTLASLLELARNTPSSKNIQPLKYILANDKEETDFIFEQLAWAKHLTEWDGPTVSERPSAYLVMLLDINLNAQALIDSGIAAQTILLGATEKGLGGCIIRTVNRLALREHYGLPQHLEIIQVIALGKPAQKVRLTSIKANGDYHYYQDEEGTHWVPKRNLDEIIYKPGK